MSAANFSGTAIILLEFLAVLTDLKKTEFYGTSGFGSKEALIESRMALLGQNEHLGKMKKPKYVEWEAAALAQAVFIKDFLTQKTKSLEDETNLEFLLSCVKTEYQDNQAAETFKLFKILNTPSSKGDMSSLVFLTSYFGSILSIMTVQNEPIMTGKQITDARQSATSTARALKVQNADALRGITDRIDAGPVGFIMSGGKLIPIPGVSSASSSSSSSSVFLGAEVDKENTSSLSNYAPPETGRKNKRRHPAEGDSYDGPQETSDFKEGMREHSKGKLSNKGLATLQNKRVHPSAAASSKQVFVHETESIEPSISPIMAAFTQLIESQATSKANAQKFKADAQLAAQKVAEKAQMLAELTLMTTIANNLSSTSEVKIAAEKRMLEVMNSLSEK